MEENHHQLKAEAEAAELLSKPQLAADMARRAENRAAVHRRALARVSDELQTLIRLAMAWSTGRYRRIPVGTLIAVLGALIYFLMPLDSIPDFVWVVGFVDDIAIIRKVVQLFGRDIQAFRDWEEAQRPDPEGTHVRG